MRPDLVAFPSHCDRLEGDWWPAATDALTTAAGTPVVVMAHGYGCTRDCGLAPFAERFAATGLHVLAFDYRGFGTSGGASSWRHYEQTMGPTWDRQVCARSLLRLPFNRPVTAASRVRAPSDHRGRRDHPARPSRSTATRSGRARWTPRSSSWSGCCERLRVRGAGGPAGLAVAAGARRQHPDRPRPLGLPGRRHRARGERRRLRDGG